MASLNQLRQAEEHREDSIKNLAWEQLQMANMQSEDRAENKRILRQMMQEQKEREMLETIERVRINNALVNFD
jgi:hypothetical protein